MGALKKKKEKEVVALSKVEKQQVLARASEVGEEILKGFAALLSTDLQPNELAEVLSSIRHLSKGLSNGVEPIAKKRLVTFLKETGDVITDKGTKEAIIGGWKIRMKPYRSGIDAKKLEALIRAKGRDPANYMTTEVSFSVSDLGLQKLQEKGIATEDELETCKYDESWTLETPERA